VTYAQHGKVEITLNDTNRPSDTTVGYFAGEVAGGETGGETGGDGGGNDGDSTGDGGCHPEQYQDIY
jgi:hypothetical protein